MDRGKTADSKPPADTGSKAGDWLRNFTNWRKPPFWLLSALLAYTLAGFFAVPWLVQNTLVKTFAESGRTASITDVRFNPYTLQLDMQGLAVDDTDGVRMLGFDTLLVNAQTSSLFRWAMTLKEFRLAGLRINEERFQGLDTRYLRLIDDLAPAGEETEPAAPTQDAGLPRLIIHRLVIDDAAMGFIDQQAQGFELLLGPISVAIDDLRTLPDHSGAQAVVINAGDRGRINWQGSIQTVPFHSAGRLTIDGDALAGMLAYAAIHLPFSVPLEEVDISLDYRLQLLADGPQLEISNLQAALTALQLVPDGDDRAVFSAREIRLDDGRMAWPAQQVAAASLDIDGAELDFILQADGNLNLLSLLPAAEADSASPATSEPWQLDLAALNVTAATVNVADQSMQPPVNVQLQEASLRMQGLNLADDTAMPVQMAAQLSSGGSLGFDGELTVFPAPLASGQLQLADVQLGLVQPYAQQHARVVITSGALNLQAELQHSPQQLLAMQGSLDVGGFELVNPAADERLLGWRALRLDRFEADLDSTAVETSVLEFEGLYGRLHIAEDLTTNLTGLLIEQPEDAASAAPEAEAGLPRIVIGGVQLTDASLDFSDFSLPLPFATAIRALDGDISTLATGSSEPARVDLEGQVNEYGLARINGTINAWDPTAQTDIQMQFRNLEMARLSPYTVQFAGYAIDEGRMDVDLDYVLDKRLMKGQNKVVVREIKLGEKVEHPGAGSLPLKLAVALLTDSEGVIDVELPVEGNLDDPQFKIGGVVMRALGNLITKVVTAPFRFLGSLVGVDSEDFGRLDFEAGSAEISPPDREKLLKLGEAMAQRPELVLEVAGVYNEELDRAALQAQALSAQLDAWLDSNTARGDELSTARERRALEALFAAAFPDQPLAQLEATHSTSSDPEQPPVLDETAYLAALRQQLTAAVSISVADLQTLAGQRARAVADMLQNSEQGATLSIEPGAAQAVEALDNNVPLELTVTAAEQP